VVKDGELGYVVEDDEGEERDENDKGGLVDSLFDVDFNISADDALDDEQQNEAAVEDGERHEVEDAEVKADGGGDVELGEPAGHFRGVAGHARNAHRTGELRDGDPPCEDAAENLDDEFSLQNLADLWNAARRGRGDGP